ncbi:MAG: hypothetical protein NTW21_15625 [Verrucomicrobia bacterium]|nr:hypothetical protein [Verrucomicrobiota bacterium]
MSKPPVIALSLAVLGCPLTPGATPSDAVLRDWNDQYARIGKQLAGDVRKQPAAAEMLDRNALILDTDRDALDVAIRRARALLAHLQAASAAGDLDPLELELERLAQRGAATGPGAAERADLYREVRSISRQVAFANPLLDFDDILFAERKCVGEDNFSGGHMTTASFGHTQLYGSGLYIARNIKSGNPVMVDVLKNASLGNGPWQGQQLVGGAVLSPELSWDGKEVLFAYAKPVYANCPRVWEYTEENSFHIFKINVEGTRLVQLTTGNHNDFDPCWLPGGRIAFISTRTGCRGPGPIFSRCFPDRGPAQFFLHSMKADGTDIIPLSFHETDEWQPSVNNDGMLVYTRWDYVDRNSNAAQHLWTCYPDGRDPRSPHGNYVHPFSTMEGKDFGPGVFTTRPCSEWHIRAVPRSASYAGASKYVATAGPHHGEPFGALVLIDVEVEDDGLASQIKRITPNRYPESEVSAKTSWDYGTPWPLSADFYLANHQDGLYLVDKFGNCDLIGTGPNKTLRPTDPIPLRPRPAPPVIPAQTWQGERASAEAPMATIAVMNVYDGDLPWPAGAKFKELRIIQYFPKSTQPLGEPSIGYAEQSLARMVLGVVPIEADGSAYFEAPVGKAIGFQVLDDKGLAVQSMRSVTYLHPGEQMTCFGCHESKWKATGVASPLAIRRPPSPIRPEVGGLEPLNFHRLVKPVLEGKCAACHQDQGQGPDMSYQSLEPYAFYLVGGKPTSGTWLTIPRHGGSRSVPGKHGAYGAPLLKYLDATHYGVDLTKEEFRRITLWLDCNSNELGAYQEEAAQRRGELVWPVFDVDPGNVLGVERRQQWPREDRGKASDWSHNDGPSG